MAERAHGLISECCQQTPRSGTGRESGSLITLSGKTNIVTAAEPERAGLPAQQPGDAAPDD
jgi:hypothetical protein